MSIASRISSLTPEQRALFELLKKKSKAAAPKVHQPPPVVRHSGPTGEGDWPLSLDQERLWFMHQLAPENTAFNVDAASHLRGPLRLPALHGALNEIVRRHAAWRTTFTEVDGRPVQRVAPRRTQELFIVDLSALPAERREPAARRLLTEGTRELFDLERGPLVRVRLLRLDAEDHICLMTVHHLVIDWISFQIVWTELAAFYDAGLTGRPAALPEPPVHYSDYAIWQREWLSGEVLDDLVEHWRGRLDGFPTVLELPVDRPRPPVQRMKGGAVKLDTGRAWMEGLRGLSRREGATSFMGFLALTYALLHRFSGQEKMILGSNNANRNRPEIEPVIGFFLTQVPFAVDLAGDPTFRELLGRVRQAALDSYAHQDLTFGLLVQSLQPPRDTSRPPLIQTLVLVLDGQYNESNLTGLAGEAVNVSDANARYDLMFGVYEQEDTIEGPIEYDADIFDHTTIERLIEVFVRMGEAVIADPETRLSRLPTLTGPARHQVLREWNDTATAAPAWTVPALFAERAARTPDAPALVFAGQTATYAALNAHAEALARSLTIAPESRVAILLDRTPALPAALLAVWKAGGACVPLDPTSPPDRLRVLLSDAAPAAVIHDGGLPEGVVPEGVTLIGLPDPRAKGPFPLGGGGLEKGEGQDGGGLNEGNLDGGRPHLDPPPVPTLPPPEGGRPHPRGLEPTPAPAVRGLAYLIYTSGTTGLPKAVMVEHGSLAHTLAALIARFGFSPGDRMPHLARFSFDIALFELLAPLLAGGTCELLTADEVLEPSALLPAIQRATRLHAVPSLMRQLAAAARRLGSEAFPRLRTLFTGGDLVPPDLLAELRDVFPQAELAVLYGPTEAAIVCTAWPVPRAAAADRTLIGRPLDGVEALVADRYGEPALMGAPGELWIGGPGVARGYFQRDELTAERFVERRFEGETRRWYRTGDLVRQLPGQGGLLEFLGRTDQQVKVRGFRVEPGEIEAVLASHPQVREAVVAAREDGRGDRRLVAWYVSEGEPLDPSALRDFLADRLPAYMVPSLFVALPELPLTTHGKVDRERLPEPEVMAAAGPEDAPRTPAEELVAGVWAEVLGLPSVSRTADFFDLGGHSLLATRVVTRLRDGLGVDLPVRSLFQSPTVEALARELETLLAAGATDADNAAPPLVPVPREGDIPLSFAQERLWFVDRLTPGTAAYNIPLAVEVEGAASPAALEAALGEMVRRHEVLRTTFGERVEGRERRPVQIIAPPAPWTLPLADLSSLPAAARETEARRLADEEVARPFDLQRGPVLRTTLLRLGAERHVLLLNVHHIAADGWSLGVMLEEIAALYRSSPLPELPVQYADFAVWQRRWLSGDALERQLAYWRDRLRGAPALELPTDRPRPAVQSHRGATRPVPLPVETARGLQELARQHDSTLFMVVLAAFQALLSRYTGQDDVVVGSPIANRNRAEVEPLIGFFVNTLVLRGDLAGDPPFTELVARARQTALEAYGHQDLPFGRLVEELRPERRLSHNPLFQVMVGVQNAPAARVGLPGLSFAAVDFEFPVARFDLEAMVWEAGESITVQLTWATDLFDAVTIDRLALHLETLLAGLAAEPERRISEVPLLGGAERHQLLHEWNDTAAELPEATLADLFREQAARRPGAVALSSAAGDLTYADLDAGSDRLARRLAAAGVGPEVPVAILTERSPAVVMGLLAIVKAGGAYVPLDPTYPAERLAWMLADSGARVLLGEPEQLAALSKGVSEVRPARRESSPPGPLSHLPPTQSPGEGETSTDLSFSPSPGGGRLGDGRGGRGVRTPCADAAFRDTLSQKAETARGLELVDLTGDPSAPDGPEPAGPLPDGLLYVMYTSGSTGRPKGVSVTHRNAVRLLRRSGFAALGPEQVFLLLAPVSFDVSTLEIWGPLANGGRLAVPAAARPSLEDIGEEIARRGVTTLWLTAGLFHQMVDHHLPALRPLRQLLAGGEALSPDHTRRAVEGLPGCAVINGYGPTEGTTFTACHRVAGAEEVAWTVPIGRPFGNTRAHVLDREMRPVPVGVWGELYAGGLGVARGYLGRPDLTAERFVPDPLAAEPGGRLYRTGDLARHRGDGRLEFLGRRDGQVKLRGYRIELGEIESALARHPGVRQAVVTARDDGGPVGRRLAAYLVGDAEVPELRRFLAETLPDYMIPTAWVTLDALPLTLNGKVDRAALPAPERPDGSGVAYVAPSSPLEETLAQAAAEILGLERVGMRDNFFDLGGHSLLATQLISRLVQEHGLDVSLQMMFEARDLAGLADRIVDRQLEEMGDLEGEDLEAMLRQMETPLEPVE